MPFIRDVLANYQTERVIAIADSGPRGPRYIGALLYSRLLRHLKTVGPTFLKEM